MIRVTVVAAVFAADLPMFATPSWWPWMWWEKAAPPAAVERHLQVRW